MRFCADIFARLLAFFFWILPRPFQWAVGSFLGWLWFDALKLRRFTVLKNICTVFPNLSKQEKWRLARLSMKHLCFGFVEFCQMPMLSKKNLATDVIFEGQENYENALKKGKGVLVLSLHIGNGDYGLAFLALQGLKLHVISKKFKNVFANQFWFGVREKMGTGFIDPHGPKTAFDILKVCRKNEGVVFVIDQFMSKPYGIETLFFGKKTGTAYGLALFAAKTGAPVIPIYTYRDQELKTHVVFEKEVAFIEDEDRDLQILKLTQEYNHRIEDIIRKHPEQWMWVHRRWKKWG